MVDLRNLAKKIGLLPKKRWFNNLIESKGLKRIEDIENELKLANERYRIEEDIQYRELKERFTDQNNPEILKFEQQITENAIQREEEIKEILAVQRKKIKKEKQLKIAIGIFVCLLLIRLTVTIISSKKNSNKNDENQVSATVMPTSDSVSPSKSSPRPTYKTDSIPDSTENLNDNKAKNQNTILNEEEDPELQKWIFNYDCDWDGADDYFSSHCGDVIKFNGNVIDAFSSDGYYYTLGISAGDYDPNSVNSTVFRADDITYDMEEVIGDTPPQFLVKQNYIVTAKVLKFDKVGGRCFIDLIKLEAR